MYEIPQNFGDIIKISAKNGPLRKCTSNSNFLEFEMRAEKTSENNFDGLFTLWILLASITDAGLPKLDLEDDPLAQNGLPQAARAEQDIP